MEKEDPKAFWKQVHNMLRGDKREQTDIDPQEWVSHFTSLLNSETNASDEQFQEFVKHSLGIIENCSGDHGVLDFEITKEDLMKYIRKLKTGKASGIDSITNEMIKEGGPFPSQCHS